MRRPKVAENVTVGSVWACVGLKTLKTWLQWPKFGHKKRCAVRVRRFKTAHQETWIRRKSDHTQDVHVGTSTSLFDLRSYFILHVVQIKCMTSCMLFFLLLVQQISYVSFVALVILVNKDFVARPGSLRSQCRPEAEVLRSLFVCPACAVCPQEYCAYVVHMLCTFFVHILCISVHRMTVHCKAICHTTLTSFHAVRQNQEPPLQRKKFKTVVTRTF